MFKFKLALFFLMGAFLLTGCISKKKLIYFQDAEPQPKISSELIEYHIKKIKELRIQPFDLLYVTVKTESDETNELFNVSSGMNSNQVMGGQQGGGFLQGKLVDQNGFVDFPKIGNVNLVNLTIPEAEKKIESILSNFVNEPYVSIRFLSFKVFLLGEVSSRGMVQIQNETVTLMEAISMSGDLTEFADRKNVMVIRGTSIGTAKDPIVYNVDLTSIDALKSRGYYLQPYDLIYVPPLTRKTLFANINSFQVIVGVFNTFIALYFILNEISNGKK